jgi:2-polyprenyl-3-methyl-5-hydroxy-6-metoxy-1,4-benzoquinol methylase
MLVGPVEDQKIPSGSLDVIALMDVLEHLPESSCYDAPLH